MDEEEEEHEDEDRWGKKRSFSAPQTVDSGICPLTPYLSGEFVCCLLHGGKQKPRSAMLSITKIYIDIYIFTSSFRSDRKYIHEHARQAEEREADRWI